MNAYILPIVLQLLALLVILAEIFVPSLGLLSVAAAGILGYSLFLAFTQISPQAGWAFVAADLVLIPLLIYWGIQALAASPLSLRNRLSKDKGVVSQAPDLEKWTGREGKALTDLRPSGLALIDGERLDVVTDGSYMEKNTWLRVVRVTGNQILVTPVNPSPHKE